MPNLPAHIHLAYQGAQKLDHPVVNRYMGPFLLGSTTPDIRAMTKWPRARTHFAPLEVEQVGSGVEGMFQAHPRLRDPLAVSPPSRAFIAGYINHLVADESWILNVYRPHFLHEESFSRKVEGNVWDRAIQLDMDRQARIEMDEMTTVQALMDGADQDVDIGFIEGETLAQWCGWVQEFNSWEFSWNRLSRAMRRMYGDDDEAKQIAQRFIDGMPDSLQQVYDLVTPDSLESYRETTISWAVKLMREYLDAPADHNGT